WLFLTFRAPEGRAAILNEASYDAAAAFSLAFLALAIIDLERVLEIAEFARGQAMIVDRGAAGLDRLIKHGMNCAHQPRGVISRLSLLRRQRCRQPARRQMRPVQRLADIDIAEPRDH